MAIIVTVLYAERSINNSCRVVSKKLDDVLTQLDERQYELIGIDIHPDIKSYLKSMRRHQLRTVNDMEKNITK